MDSSLSIIQRHSSPRAVFGAKPVWSSIWFKFLVLRICHTRSFSAFSVCLLFPCFKSQSGEPFHACIIHSSSKQGKKNSRQERDVQQSYNMTWLFCFNPLTHKRFHRDFQASLTSSTSLVGLMACLIHRIRGPLALNCPITTSETWQSQQPL